LHVEYTKEFNLKGNKNKKYALSNALSKIEGQMSRVDIFGILVFVLLYNFGGVNVRNVSLAFFLGILSNIFIFKFCFKCFLEKKL
jgi:preprotein translocase subunit SecF